MSTLVCQIDKMLLNGCRIMGTSQLLQLQVSQDSDAPALDVYATQAPYPHAL